MRPIWHYKLFELNYVIELSTGMGKWNKWNNYISTVYKRTVRIIYVWQRRH